MKVYIQEPLRAAFIDEMCREYEPPDIIDAQCPRCGESLEMPVVARRHHVDAFDRILEIGHEYLAEHGVVEKMLDELKNIILKELAKQAPINIQAYKTKKKIKALG